MAGATLLCFGGIFNGLAAAGTLPVASGTSQLAGANLLGKRRRLRLHVSGSGAADEDSDERGRAGSVSRGGRKGRRSGGGGGEEDDESESESGSESESEEEWGEPSTPYVGHDRLASPLRFVLGVCGAALPLQAIRDAFDGSELPSQSLVDLRLVSALCLSSPQLFFNVALLSQSGLYLSLRAQPWLVASLVLSLVTAASGIACGWTERALSADRRACALALDAGAAPIRIGGASFVAADLLARSAFVSVAVIMSAPGSPWLLLVLLTPFLYLATLASDWMAAGHRARPGSGMYTSGGGPEDANASASRTRAEKKMAAEAAKGHGPGGYSFCALLQLLGPHAGPMIDSQFLATDAVVSSVIVCLATALCLCARPMAEAALAAITGGRSADGGYLGGGGVSGGGADSFGLGINGQEVEAEVVEMEAEAALSQALTAVVQMLAPQPTLEEASVCLWLVLCCCACKLAVFVGCVWPSRVGGSSIGVSLDPLALARETWHQRKGKHANGSISALHHAALTGSVWMAEFLMRRGADPSTRDSKGRTPLHLAAAYGQVGVVDLLMQVEQREHGKLAAALAVAAAKAEADAKAKAKAEARARRRRRRGQQEDEDEYDSDYYISDEDEDEDVEDEAVAASADPTASAPAASATMPLTVLATKPPSALECRDAYGRSALCTACLRGETATADRLLALGAKLEHAGNDGATPLLLASSHGRTGTAQLLIHRSASVEYCDHEGGSALLSACANGHSSLAIILIVDHFADVESHDSQGRTPLIWAAANGHTHTARLLLRRNARLEAVTHGGYTPLCRAAANGHVETVRMLLSHGADLEHLTRSGSTALLHACHAGQLETARALLWAGADVGRVSHAGFTALHLAAEHGHGAAVSLLLSYGASVHHADFDGDSPLSDACHKGHEAIADSLIKAGADIDHPNHAGQTPLHLACLAGHPAVASLLITRGAAVDVVASDGRTPLLWACAEGSEDVATMLIERGANLNTMDSDGDTALSLSDRRGHITISALLRRASREWWRDLYVELMILKEYPPWDLERGEAQEREEREGETKLSA